MVRLGNFKFSIIQPDRRALPEYNDPAPNPDPSSFASCYVETPHPSKSQQFRIRIEAIKPLNYNHTNGYGFSIFCDGREDLYVWVISTPKLFQNSERVIIDAYCVKDERTGKLEGKNLQFQPIEAVSDGAPLTVDKECLGTIEISMGEISGIYHTSDADIEEEGEPIPALAKVHKADLQGSSATHCIRLGQTAYKNVENDFTFDFDYTPNYQAVRFYYRSREALQDMGIIPREYSGLSTHRYHSHGTETLFPPFLENRVEENAERWLLNNMPASPSIKIKEEPEEIQKAWAITGMDLTSIGYQEDNRPIKHEYCLATALTAHEERDQEKPFGIGSNLNGLLGHQCARRRTKRALSLDSSLEGLSVGSCKRLRLSEMLEKGSRRDDDSVDA